MRHGCLRFSSSGHETGDISERPVQVPALRSLQVCREYGIDMCFGERNPHLSVSVSSPPDVATFFFRILDEGEDPCCPWSIFQINFGDINTFRQSYEWERRRKQIQVLNHVSGLEMRIERVEKVGPKEMAYSSKKKGHRGGKLVTRCGR